VQKPLLFLFYKFYSTTPKGFEFMRKYGELLTLSIAGNLQITEEIL